MGCVCCVHLCTGIQESEANEGELAAFVAYACAFPARFLCLVDNYDVIRYVLLLTLVASVINNLK